MAKVKTAFFCSSCGTQFSKWLGQCTACKQWNTIVEEVIQKEEKVAWQTKSSAGIKRASKPLLINEIDSTQETGMNPLDKELNGFLGGEFFPGSIFLLGGDPVIEKSTFLLKLSLKLL